MAQRVYIAIDLKSFYASVECVERGLNPLTTNLVVADESRTEKTICLAVSPSLKAYGVGGRPRLFEVVQRVREVNALRRGANADRPFTGKSWRDDELQAHPDWEVDFLRARPRMALYIDYSTRVYHTYLKYISAEDIHVYSIDEVFMDVTDYLDTYRMNARQLAVAIIRDVLCRTGVTATAGIGSNLYLAKIAMDIVAKHMPADKDGVRIAELDEMGYRRLLWDHRPITDFWRVGGGIARRLALHGMDTMGKVARCSVHNEALLYHLFGVNAELLIDHAWGWEPCTMSMVKAYRPATTSLGSGQVLSCPYTADKALTVTMEMADELSLSLVDKRLLTDRLVLTVGYDAENLTDPAIASGYYGKITTDHYGRPVPKHTHGTISLGRQTSSTGRLINAAAELFDRIVDKNLLVRRLNLTACHVVTEEHAEQAGRQPVQLDLFTDYEALRRQEEQEKAAQAKERRMQEAILQLKKRFGKNAVLRGLNFAEGSTGRERNARIGGHKA